VEGARSLSSPLGRISISHDAVAQIVARTASEAYGIVGMAPGAASAGSFPADRRGIDLGGTSADGVAIELRVVVEYGLNLAEVASTVRNRVRYEVERLTGLTVASVVVHIEDVRRSADLEWTRELGRAALTVLERNRRRVDDLNVYPVPDGDTGTNLTLSVRSVVEALRLVDGGRPRGDRPRRDPRRAMGARGNSG